MIVLSVGVMVAGFLVGAALSDISKSIDRLASVYLRRAARGEEREG